MGGIVLDKDKSCENCRYYRFIVTEGKSMCMNLYSPFATDYMRPYETCRAWERRKDGKADNDTD